MSRGKALLSLSLGIAVVALGIIVLVRPFASSRTSSSPPAPVIGEVLEVASTGDRSAASVPVDLTEAVRSVIAQLQTDEPADSRRELTERAVALVSASVPEDFASLENLMHRLGGDYFTTDAEFEGVRRWWRSVPNSRRPDFAVDMTGNEWERWIDRAGAPELTRLPDDTRAPIRAIDRERIQSSVFLDDIAAMTRSIDTTIRAIARDMGFANAEKGRIVSFRGRLRYRPAIEDEPLPTKFAVVFVPGVTTDDRDFVAAYIFGYREPTGWFPYYVRCLSQHRETTPPQRQIPFVPAF